MQWYERLDEKIRDYLPDMTVERDVPMSRHTSFRIGGPARRMAFPESREQLVILLGLAEECGIRPFLLGRGTNLLVSDRGLDTLVIKTAERMTSIRRLDDVTLEADVGVLLSRLAVYAQQAGLAGLEFAHGIPGSLGGAVCMNAGAYGGEMRQVVTEVTAPVPRRHPPLHRGPGRICLPAQPVSGGRSRGAGGRGAPDPGRSRRHTAADG